MECPITRYTARWVLPITAPPIRDGAVLVDNAGRIAAAGAEPDVPLPAGATSVDLGEAALLPGLVNVHAHPELSCFRGLLEDLPFHIWIPALMRARRNAVLTADDYRTAAAWSCLEAVAAGITCMAATEESGAAIDALVDTGMRGIVYCEVFGPATTQAAEAVAGLAQRVGVLRRRENDLVRAGISPHAPYSVSDELFRRTAALALAENLPVAVHAAESVAEMLLVTSAEGPFADGLRARDIATMRRGASTIELLDRLGVLRARPLLIHCVHASSDDVRRIAAAGAAVAHCPAANARLGHGIAPLIELLDAGIPVGLGTDSVAANNRLDMLEEARFAQMLQRARLQSPELLPAERLLRLATLDGARALGLDSRIGSLEPGKDADLCAVALDRPHVQPVHDPAAAVVHAARAADVVLTVVRGRQLFRDGHALTVDAGALRPALDDAAARLRRARSVTG